MDNIDSKTVASFGDEWERFGYGSEGVDDDVLKMFDSYFGWLGDEFLESNWKVADFGCGSGRWAKMVAPRVYELCCIDASESALNVARRNLEPYANCTFVNGALGGLKLSDRQFDFGYCLGVLHHVPNTEKGLRDCIRLLKPRAPLLLYLYYALDNRPMWYRFLWRLSDAMRRSIAALPHAAKLRTCDIIAAIIYWPLARLSRLGERCGRNVSSWLLSYYRDRSFYVMRNDALDRFGTRLEKRFSKSDIKSLMERCGLRDIRFSDATPYWVAVGYKSSD